MLSYYFCAIRYVDIHFDLDTLSDEIELRGLGGNRFIYTILMAPPVGELSRGYLEG